MILAGLLDNRSTKNAVRALPSKPSLTNDFRELNARLFAIATDFDSGETIEVGSPAMSHVPMSQAVQASAALRGFTGRLDEFEVALLPDAGERRLVNCWLCGCMPFAL